MHKFNPQSNELQCGFDLGYYGIFLSRRIVPAGEDLNVMTAIYNKNSFTLTRRISLYVQRADVAEAPWREVVSKDVLFPAREGKHVYLIIRAEDMARLQDETRRISPAEYVIFCGPDAPSPGSEKRRGVSDLFCIVGEAVLHK